MKPWTPFFQTEKLTTRIHNILREYPPGLGTFKEFIQNADDAKATHFSLLYDRSSHGTESLLSPNMAEWQGPALYIYNSASFTDGDFEGITQVGNSGKVSDPTTIGKYGLGFNCSYHFTDLVSFMSRDQLIYFDPHGLFLPDGVLGLRSNFKEFEYPSRYSDVLDPYKFEEFQSLGIPSSMEGTIFRLPLRNKEQAEKSLLSKCHYGNNELMELIHQFAKEAGEMMLLLNHIEDIKILIRDEHGHIERIAHIYISNITEEWRHSRAHRNIPSSGESKSTIYSVQLTEQYLDEKCERAWMVSASARHRVLTEIERQMDSSATIQWVNVACCCNDVIESGRVYCSLPLPMSTGYPVHINGNFALSSNRRHLWEQSEGEQSGPAAFKSRWNQELAKLVAHSYFNLLEKMKEIVNHPDDLYNYWPVSSDSHFFQQHMLPAFVRELIEEERPLFWDKGKKKWLAASNVIFPDRHLEPDDKFYDVLHSIHLVTVFPPSSHLAMLKSSKVPLPTLSPMNLIDFLKELHPRTISSSAVADELLNYILRGSQDMKPHQIQRFIKHLEGLPILPLENNQVGVIRSGGKTNPSELYLICMKAEFMKLLPSCKQFVASNAISIPKLQNTLFQQYSNVKDFTPTILPLFMSFVVPKTWYNVSSVFVSGRLLHEHVLNISMAHVKHKKKAKKIPSGLVTARDPSVHVPELSERLDLLWKFLQEYIQDDKFISGLNSWPIILVDSLEGQMVCTIDVCRRKGALSYQAAKKYGEDGVAALRQYGCRFFSLKEPIVKKLIGKRNKVESLNCIIQFLSSNRQLEILQADSLVLRRIVISWMREDDFIITKPQIESLPLFVNLSGNESLRITNSQVIVPPIEWMAVCQAHYADYAVNTQDPENNLLLHKIASSVPSVKSFFANHLCKDLDSLPQSVCIEFLRSIGDMKESESIWFAPHNKENKQILQALESKKLIVFDDGYRCGITEIMDTSDNVLSTVMQSKNSAHVYAPEVYRNDPLIQRVLKKLPVRSLANWEVFEQIAKEIESSGSIEMGHSLVRFLAKSHQMLKWSSPQCNAIGQIAFIPCWDLRKEAFIRFLEDVPDKCTKLCALRDGILFEETLSGWTQGFIFCREVSEFPSKFQSRMNINRSVPTPMLLNHLQALLVKLRPYGNTIPEKYRQAYLGILKKTCTRLDTVVRKHAKSSAANVKHTLSMSRFVMLDNGELVYAHQLCFDLEEDLGPFARAVPSYLQQFQKLFAGIGTPMITEAKAPPVNEVGGKPHIPTMLIEARNDASFSDLKFTLLTESAESFTFYAHKFVVCSHVPVLRTMFTSGMKEALIGQGKYELPHWVDWNAFLMVMDYCYTGDLMFERKLSPFKESDVSLMTEILRISDVFLMNHLKSVCEVFLSSVQIDVFNVCSLLEIAEMCNASQLVDYCVFTIRIMFATVQQTEEWKELSKETQNRILAGSLFVGGAE